MCGLGLFAQCETTQVREQGTGAALFGYTKLYGQVPGGQAEYPAGAPSPVRADQGPDGPSDDRFVYLSDVLPTAWQAVAYADMPDGGSVVVFGLGPIGQMCCRIAAAPRLPRHRRGPDHRTSGDGRPHGIDVLNGDECEDVPAAIRDLTGGRGTDSVIDAVGMEAHGSPVAKVAHTLTGLLPDAVAAPVMSRPAWTGSPP